jgi:glutamate N-acetyltransferase/amino-acid N-acetyltransferase
MSKTSSRTSPVIGGGVTSAAGFVASGVHAGFRRNPSRLDLALVVAERPCAVAATFTRNVFASAPVQVSRRHLAGGVARAVVVNSGNANAATGAEGLVAAERICEVVADAVGCEPVQVLEGSTGVVGVPLPMAPFDVGVPAACERLSLEGGSYAASAILTTDTFAKEYAVSYVSQAPGLEGTRVTVGGMTKGSGMIMPNMATMIAVITTDLPISSEVAQQALWEVVDDSFNKVIVDADTSPNDTCIMLASGLAAPGARVEVGDAAYLEFVCALDEVCQFLARLIAFDGEGSTKLVTVTVRGAATDAEAKVAARGVASSTLVKTAIFGHDCNWGRIAVALGTSGASFLASDVDIDIMGIPVCRSGMAMPFDEDEALRRFEGREVAIDCDLGAGTGTCRMWTCDLTYDYVRINGEYRT